MPGKNGGEPEERGCTMATYKFNALTGKDEVVKSPFDVWCEKQINLLEPWWIKHPDATFDPDIEAELSAPPVPVELIEFPDELKDCPFVLNDGILFVNTNYTGKLVDLSQCILNMPKCEDEQKPRKSKKRRKK